MGMQFKTQPSFQTRLKGKHRWVTEQLRKSTTLFIRPSGHPLRCLSVQSLGKDTLEAVKFPQLNLLAKGLLPTRPDPDK